MFRVGLTGGIASGKTTVAEMFAELGVPIIDTDVIAREVVRPGCPALDEIRSRFGTAVITGGGELDRRALRRIAFSGDQNRLDLERILHPRIREETLRQAAAAGGPYQIIVIPLLVGSALEEYVDRILVVDCDVTVQLRRLLGRDAETREQAERMIAAQASRDDRLAVADDVINNDGDLDDTRRQVGELHRRYLALAGAT